MTWITQWPIVFQSWEAENKKYIIDNSQNLTLILGFCTLNLFFYILWTLQYISSCPTKNSNKRSTPYCRFL